MCQHKNSKLADSFNKLPYFISSCRRLTRQRALANCSRFRTKFTDLPLHMFPKIWNELNPKFQEIASFGLFKRSVRAGYIEEYWIMLAVKIPHAINVISHHNGLKQLFNFTVYKRHLTANTISIYIIFISYIMINRLTYINIHICVCTCVCISYMIVQIYVELWRYVFVLYIKHFFLISFFFLSNWLC